MNLYVYTYTILCYIQLEGIQCFMILLYVYVNMYIYIYIYIYIYTYLYIYIYVVYNVQMSEGIPKFTVASTYNLRTVMAFGLPTTARYLISIYILTYVYLCIQIYIHMHVHLYTCTYTWCIEIDLK
jgi:hypothetical protein